MRQPRPGTQSSTGMQTGGCTALACCESMVGMCRDDSGVGWEEEVKTC